MTDDNINLAIDNARPGISKYLDLMDTLYAVDVSKDTTFQTKYKGFYRVRQKSEAWYAAYFGLMEECKTSRPTFAEVLDALRVRIGNDAYEPSFSSKLVATLNSLSPVWDVYVLRNIGLMPPSYTSRTKHNDSKTAYASIVGWYDTFMRSSEGRRWIRLFNERVDDYYRISDIKKVDFILWQIRDRASELRALPSRSNEPLRQNGDSGRAGMKVVIQCASGKDHAAGTMKTKDGKFVLFVGDPAHAPQRSDVVYARPDDPADDAWRWRDHLLGYNREPGDNPLGLLPAWKLYRHPAYATLVERFGTEKVFILSAGWGLLRADFLTPSYDITFSAQADTFKRRRTRDAYDDLNMLEARDTEPVVFFGGKDYLPLFCRLTEHYAGKRTAIFNSASEPQAHGVRFVRYHTSTRTNWHYEAATAFLNGAFSAA